MQKDDRSYTFFLSHTTKTKIYIRRIEVSKKLLYSGVGSLILSFGLITLGFTGFINSNTIAKIETNIPIEATLTAQPIKSTPNIPKAEYTSINYDRPASSESFSVSSGGPAVPFQLTVVESEAEENGMEVQLRLIETTSNPAFVPTMWAHLGKINNEFGFRRNPFGGRSYEFHAGMDIGGERGDLVVAPANGIVISADWQGGYGNMVEIDHGNGLTTRYGHLSVIGVQAGDTIQRGQAVGLVGSTGRSTGPHLHYELRLNDKSINPRRFLLPEPAEMSALNAE
ncbi:MAG: M23 family metallopeptidase [Pyrinomonadaceae bacterium]